MIQSLLGLSKLLPFLNDERYTSILVSLAIRIKQFFERVSNFHCNSRYVDYLIRKTEFSATKCGPFSNNRFTENVFFQEDTETRRLSLKLFGELVTLSNVDASSFNEQVFRNLVCLFFHLGEKEVLISQVNNFPFSTWCRLNSNLLYFINEILQTCKFSLRAISHLVKSVKLRSMIEKHLIDDRNLNYQSYIPKIAEIMVSESIFQQSFGTNTRI